MSEMREHLQRLQCHYQERKGALQMKEIAGELSNIYSPGAGPLDSKMVEERPAKLSRASLEAWLSLLDQLDLEISRSTPSECVEFTEVAQDASGEGLDQGAGEEGRGGSASCTVQREISGALWPKRHSPGSEPEGVGGDGP